MAVALSLALCCVSSQTAARIYSLLVQIIDLVSPVEAFFTTVSLFFVSMF